MNLVHRTKVKGGEMIEKALRELRRLNRTCGT